MFCVLPALYSSFSALFVCWFIFSSSKALLAFLVLILWLNEHTEERICVHVYTYTNAGIVVKQAIKTCL